MSQQATASHAQRASIQHAVGAVADGLLYGDDRLPHLDEHERAVRLAAAVGAVCQDIYLPGVTDLDGRLLRVAAEVALWLEVLERERAAA